MTDATRYDQAELEAVARALVDHRRDGTHHLVGPPESRPTDVARAYAIQAAVHRLLTTERGHTPIGHKIAATNPMARAHLSIDSSFHGRLYDRSTTPSPAELPAGVALWKVYEPEIGLVIGRDLGPAGAPYTAADIEAATRAVLPAIEIAGTCLEPWTQAGVANLISDNACHGHWIPGAELADWSGLDLLDLPITLIVDGEVAATGSPRNVDGGPFGATAWLVNTLAEAGEGLRAGDRITTGVTTAPVETAPGQHVVADFGPLGSVELRLAPA